MGLSLNNSLIFFKKYILGLKAIDIFINMIISYSHETYNRNVNPRTLYIFVNNNHCYRLNCNSFCYKQVVFGLKNFQKKLDVTSKFPLPKTDDKSKHIFIEKLDDVVLHIIKNKYEIKFIYDGNMQDIIIEMVNYKYIPELIFKDNSVKGLQFKFGEKTYKIQYSSMASDTVNIIEPEDYDPCREMNKDINQWLINESFISRISEKTKETFKEYFINPLTVTFEQTEKQLLSRDRNKLTLQISMTCTIFQHSQNLTTLWSMMSMN